MDVFFEEDDYHVYLDLVSSACRKVDTSVWAYCLMSNHVHFVMVPKHEDGLRAALAEAHKQYTRHINFREGCRGHLWQERFHSFAMDEHHLLAAVRYVELNPVHAGMVKRAEDYPWSSAKAHLEDRDDGVVKVKPMLSRVDSWSDYLSSDLGESEKEAFRRHGRTGRPLGDDRFMKKIERLTGIDFRPKKVGRKGNRYTVPE